MIADEMGTIGRLAILERSFGLLAGYGIRLWAFLQDIHQLRDTYNSWGTFVANSDIFQVISAGEPETSEYISKMLGNKTECKRSQWTINHIREKTRTRIAARDKERYRIWWSHAEDRTIWEAQRRHQKFQAVKAMGNPKMLTEISTGDRECWHPEHEYPGDWVIGPVTAKLCDLAI